MVGGEGYLMVLVLWFMVMTADFESASLGSISVGPF